MGAVGKYLRSLEGGQMAFWCPACNEPHAVRLEGADVWTYNGKPEAPTFLPSVDVSSGHYMREHVAGQPCWCTYNAAQRAKGDEESGFKCCRCHSFVTDGRIQFLGDCTHALAGQTVDLPPWEE